MLVLARGRLAGRRGVSFVQADALALPMATGCLDAVLVATMLGEVPDPGRCVGELRRVLRPGGVMAVSETRRDSDFIALAALRSLVEPRRFRYLGRRGVGLQYTARFEAV
jgi:ubiquinone/menaquinone biosynthesis C-methylase UbiE